MPLSTDELQELYASNLLLTPEDVAELSQALPYLGDVLNPDQFRAFVLRQNSAARTGSNRDPDQGVAAHSEPTVAVVADLCGSSSAKVVLDLRKAVGNLLAETYEAAYGRLVDLSGKRETFRRRNALIAKLALAAPNWAEAIAQRAGVHAAGNIPGDPIAAWHWRQRQQDQVRIQSNEAGEDY